MKKTHRKAERAKKSTVGLKTSSEWAKCPGGETSRWRNVQWGVKRPVKGQNIKGAKRPVTQTSISWRLVHTQTALSTRRQVVIEIGLLFKIWVESQQGFWMWWRYCACHPGCVFYQHWELCNTLLVPSSRTCEFPVSDRSHTVWCSAHGLSISVLAAFPSPWLADSAVVLQLLQSDRQTYSVACILTGLAQYLILCTCFMCHGMLTSVFLVWFLYSNSYFILVCRLHLASSLHTCWVFWLLPCRSSPVVRRCWTSLHSPCLTAMAYQMHFSKCPYKPASTCIKMWSIQRWHCTDQIFK